MLCIYCMYIYIYVCMYVCMYVFLCVLYAFISIVVDVDCRSCSRNIRSRSIRAFALPGGSLSPAVIGRAGGPVEARLAEIPRDPGAPSCFREYFLCEKWRNQQFNQHGDLSLKHQTWSKSCRTKNMISPNSCKNKTRTKSWNAFTNQKAMEPSSIAGFLVLGVNLCFLQSVTPNISKNLNLPSKSSHSDVLLGPHSLWTPRNGGCLSHRGYPQSSSKPLDSFILPILKPYGDLGIPHGFGDPNTLW